MLYSKKEVYIIINEEDDKERPNFGERKETEHYE